MVDLARARLVAQSLVGDGLPSPLAAVASSGAMQGQDLPGVLASAALRSSGRIADVLEDLDSGRLVRGYPMRGTVFLMSAADAVWVTQLCAAPALRSAAARRHQLGIDASQLSRARDLTQALLVDGPMARAELLGAWEAHGLAPQGGRGYHLLFSLIADGLVVYGPWNGSEQDVALADQWLRSSPTLEERFAGERIPAVAELLRRYLASHGPATLRDFAWWTKLTLGEIRKALPLVVGLLESDGADEGSYWRPGLLDEVSALRRATAQPLLLPGFDEYILGYADRTFAAPTGHLARLVPGNNGVFRRSVIVGGRVLGTWSRVGRPGGRRLEIEAFEPIPDGHVRRLERRFAAFPFVTS